MISTAVNHLAFFVGPSAGISLTWVWKPKDQLARRYIFYYTNHNVQKLYTENLRCHLEAITVYFVLSSGAWEVKKNSRFAILRHFFFQTENSCTSVLFQTNF